MLRAFIRIKTWFFRLPAMVRYAVCAGTILRLVGLVLVLRAVGVDSLVYADGTGYMALATSLAHGQGFGLVQGGSFVLETFRTPGLPFLLTPFVTWSSGLVVYLLLLTLVSGIAIPLLMWWIGKETLGERSGRIGAWLGALEPLMIVFSWLPLTEMPFLLFGLASAAAWIRARQTASWKWAIVSGALGAYAVLIRPGNIFLFFLTFVALLAADGFRRLKPYLKLTVIVAAAFVICLAPWYVRTWRVTGTVALSGAGWRNVYTDYLASVRAVEHGTTFWDEKAKLKDDAETQLGIARVDLGNPANAALLRKVAIAELIQHPVAVVKLESLLMVSFFTNDGYYAYLLQLGLLPKPPERISPTYAFLRQGFGAIGPIFRDLAREYFIPLLGRLVTVVIFLSAVVGVIRNKRSVRWLFVLLILMSALSASAIGLGVEGRLRLSIAPLLFLLAGAAFERRSSSHDHA